MSGFVKLYGELLTSSVWLEDDATLRVWIGLLVLADADGYVGASVGGLAHVCRVSREACSVALEKFMSPDPDSRTPDNEGRRIETADGGWRVLNAKKYRDLRSPKQIADAERIREKRERGEYDSKGPVEGATSATRSNVALEVDVEVEVETTKTSSSSAREAAALNVGELSRLLITRCNQGMKDNPLIGELYHPIPHGHAKSFTAADTISKAGVDPEFAASVVYSVATAYEPSGRNKQISTLGYCTSAVLEQWEQHEARTSASDASRPAAIAKHDSRRAVRMSPGERSRENTRKLFEGMAE